KPDPAVYTAVLKALHTHPNQALALEDSPVGIHAANAAGLRCVAVPNELTRHLNLDHAHLQIKSLADLPLEDLLAQVSPT
ncbi:MAG: HAD-IA family hydrolase, partial [bacterium]|nr:HAD-IA family hydrolase [bacterium]